jgi:hypothetical protein
LPTLQQQIDNCLAGPAETLPDDHADRVALKTFVRNRARGVAVNVQTDGPRLLLNKTTARNRYG